jgi:MoaA/NifB/PqqE/SkfB family radical SAM enzyme
MERVDIKIGFQCNNLCKFCVQGRKRDTLPTKTREEVAKALKEAYNNNKREVVFTGGEPTMHPEILDFVRMAKDMGYPTIQLQSNGRMFSYRKFCVDAIKAGATHFSPALHGSSAEIHDYLTSVPGSYEQTVGGIKNLKELGQYVMINSVITSHNYKDLPRLATLLVGLHVDQFQFAFIHLGGTAFKNRRWITPRKSDIMPYVKKGLDIGIRNNKMVTTEAIPFCLMQGYEECIAENIMPKATIYDANFVVEDYDQYRKDSGKGKIKAEKCKKCKFYNVCEGPWNEYPELFGWDEFNPQ